MQEDAEQVINGGEEGVDHAKAELLSAVLKPMTSEVSQNVYHQTLFFPNIQCLHLT